MTDSQNVNVDLPWTGERYLPEVGGNIELEHIHRYLLANRFSAGKRVLDIACGEGYGSALMAQTAASVVGVDIAADAVTHAGAKYRSRNLSFKVGSCAAIPLPDRSVDVVVSFETIEHHDEHAAMMREIKRVLVPDGILVISSPDKLEYSDRTGNTNSYHVKELYRSEFESLLDDHFKFHRISGQRIIYGSAIFAEDGPGNVSSFGVNDKVLLPAPGIGRPLYLVAIASDHELPFAESGILEQPVEDSDNVQDAIRQIRGLAQTVSERDGQIAGLNLAVGERDQRIVGLDQVLGTRDGEIRALNDGIVERDRLISSLGEAVAEREGRIAGHLHAVAERDARIASLGDAVTGLDGQIAELTHAVTERDRQVATLEDALGERDQRIAGLAHTAAEHETRIVNLTAAVAARDAQIAELDDAFDERGARIDGLGQAIAERDARLAGLHDAVAERDRQIAHLRQTLTDLDHRVTHLREKADQRAGVIAALGGEIGRLRNDLAERDGRIGVQDDHLQSLLHSHSWRWTRPLRAVTGSLRSGTRPLRAAVARRPAPQPTLADEPARRIEHSPLFDHAFYTSQNPDVVAAGIEPATHYFRSGWTEGRDPSAHFSTSGYLRDNPDVAAAGINPLLHYIDAGRAEGRSLASSPEVIGKAAEDVVPATASPSVPAAVDDVGHGASATPAGSAAFTAGQIDIEVAAISSSGLFDSAFYLAMNPDVEPELIDPLRHYCERGWREGRNPSSDFDSSAYLDAYSDIKSADLNPLWHYAIAGAMEGRQGTFDPKVRFEDEAFFGSPTSDICLIAYYAVPDWEGVQRAHNASAGQRPLPHDDLGFYSGSDGVTLAKQTSIAKRHGIDAWCFSIDAAAGPEDDGPLSQLLAAHDIDIRFCVEFRLGTATIDVRTVACLEAAFRDDRYLMSDGLPVVVTSLPDRASERSTAIERFDEVLTSRRLLRPYRIARLNGSVDQASSAAIALGVEAVLCLPVDPVPDETGTFKPYNKNGVETVPYCAVVSQGIARMRAPVPPDLPVYHAVTLGRDDSPTDPVRPLTYSRFHLKEYRRWLDAAIADARSRHRPDGRLLFVNAWNDWNHGAVLEPDRFGGYSKLNETSRAMLGMVAGRALPKVSVIVPNYNHALYLPRRLESIYRQTYKNIEVLLLDDCSKDQSRALLTEYADRYPDCTATLFNAQNSGSVFRQWAKGIGAASGDLIWIAESDDYCDENFLEELVQCFEDEAVMLAYAKVEFVRPDESVVPDEFAYHVRDLPSRNKWQRSYVNSAHREVREGLGIVNTIPNASGVVFRRPVDMALLEDDAWLSMAVVGDWLFYLHLIRGGKVAYSTTTTNYFRRYDSSTAASTYHKETFYRELGIAAQTVQRLYDVPEDVIARSRERSRQLYDHYCSTSAEEFASWFDEPAIFKAREGRTPNILISTMAFYPGGAEILPIRIANELKRVGHSVLLLSVGLTEREDGVRRMLRRDVPVVETSSIEETEALIRDFGIEVLNSHQWHVQKYPAIVPQVFQGLKAHVASLHGMIEHGHAFGVTPDEIKIAHENVSTWIYTADKNLSPFMTHGLYTSGSRRFTKLPNGMEPPTIRPIPRSEIGMPADAFVLCCVSRAIPDKGWAEAIEAVTLARELAKRDIRLILVGNGPVYEDYRRVGVPEFVHLAGFSDNSVGYYAAADMGIMLTKFPSESFPLTIVDCLFAGKPYISCDVGEIFNMLTDEGRTAGAVVSLVDWCVPVSRAAEIIAAYASDQSEYADAQAIVPKLVTRYRIDRVVERYVAVFREAMQRSASLEEMPALSGAGDA